jgi:hypothetical protein
MNDNGKNQIDDLNEIIDQKLTALFVEMQDAGWKTDDVAFVVGDVLNAKWLDRARTLRATRDAMPDNFVSDGNEG